MRLVIDTNIFISAALKDKSFPAVTLHLSKQHGILLKSDATERQLFDVLARPHFRRLVSPATLEWFRAGRTGSYRGMSTFLCSIPFVASRSSLLRPS
jgi:predicted nucleic acid-binding protein